MSITVKDIQEKEFATVQGEGYDADQVDDFLDALAEDWGAILRENLTLTEQVHALQDSLDAAQAANAEMEKKLPDYNEKEYFQNLERGVREALIGAQRIADEAVSESQRNAREALEAAQRKARETVEGAQAQAERTVAEADERARVAAERAQQVVADLNAEADRLRGAIESYRAKLKTLLDEHMAILNSDEQN